MSDRLDNERGASLIMVIIFVMMFGIITAAILDFASTGFKVTSEIRKVRDLDNEVDGAVEGAINAIRISNAGYVDEPGCLTGDPAVFEYTTSGGDDVEVTCRVAGGSTGAVDDNMPAYAVLTLGEASCEGFFQLGNDAMTIDGGVSSNNRIDIATGVSGCSAGGGAQSRLHVDGDVFAVGACTPGTGDEPTRITKQGAIDCDRGAGGVEPRPPYPPAISDISTLPIDPRATCGSGTVAQKATRVVKFVPGVYTEHLRNHVPTECSTPTNTVWWLSPGVYYFDFPAPDSSSVLDMWDINGQPKNLVGGTPKGWTEDSLATAVDFPDAACDPGTEELPNPGVQLIFGGQTRLRTQSDNSGFARGEIELCANAFGATNQRIVVYGLDATNGFTRTPVALTDPAAKKVAAVGSVTAVAGSWDDPSKGRVIEEPPAATEVATASLDGDIAASKVATLGYGAFDDVPSGSLISKVFIDVRHSEFGNNPDKVNLSLTVTYGSGSQTFTVPRSTNANPPAFATFSQELTGYLKPAFRYEDLNSITAEFKADGGPLAAGTPESGKGCPNSPQCKPAVESQKANVQVDGVHLRVEYTPPGLQAHAFPTCASSSCALIHTTSNPYTVLHGTVFAPSARLDIDLHNGGRTNFRRGVIVRTMHVDACPCSTQSDVPFSLPGLEDVRIVDFIATVDGEERVKARVRFRDTPVLGHEVTVLGWRVIR